MNLWTISIAITGGLDTAVTSHHQVEAENQADAIRELLDDLQPEDELQLEHMLAIVVSAAPVQPEQPPTLDLPIRTHDDHDPYGELRHEMLQKLTGSHHHDDHRKYTNEHPEFEAEYQAALDAGRRTKP